MPNLRLPGEEEDCGGAIAGWDSAEPENDLVETCSDAEEADEEEANLVLDSEGENSEHAAYLYPNPCSVGQIEPNLLTEPKKRRRGQTGWSHPKSRVGMPGSVNRNWRESPNRRPHLGQICFSTTNISKQH